MNWPLGAKRYGSYGWLLREVGDALGMGPDYNAFDYEEYSRLESIVQRGLRNFYAPQPLPGERTGHQWSFLYPTVQIHLATNTAVYDLPEGFEALTGPITYDTDQNTFKYRIEITSERAIAQRKSHISLSAIPTHAAVRVKEHDADAEYGTLYEIVFDPAPNGDYTVNVPVKVAPPFPSEETDMPYGGEQHYETIRLACLAAVNPEYQEAYIGRLVTSVGHDRLANAADTLGRNIDTSDGVVVENYRELMDHVVVYKGY